MIFHKVRLGFIVCDKGIFFIIIILHFFHLKDKLMRNRRFKLYSTHCKVPDYKAITAWVAYDSNPLKMNE